MQDWPVFIGEFEGKPALIDQMGFLISSELAEKIVLAGLTHWGISGGQIYQQHEDVMRARGIKPQPRMGEMRVPPPRFVYLMKNERSGLFKIGVSSDPKAREGTLQGEEPEIALVLKKPGSYPLEKRLHEAFASKRVRGEWFRLDTEDLRRFETLVTEHSR